MNETRTQTAVYALAASDHAVFAASSAGVLRSQDGGQTWHNTFETPPELLGAAATALAAQGGRVVAGTAGGLAISTDGGQTWQVVGLAVPPPLVIDIALAPGGDLILAGTADDGVFVSRDSGSTWAAWNFGLFDHRINCLSLAPDQMTVFTGTESGLFRSANGGQSWREVPFPPAAAPVLSLALTPTHLFAGTPSSGLLCAAVPGYTWSAVPALTNLSGEAVQALLPAGADILILTDHHLLRLETPSLTGRTLAHFPERAALAFTPTAQQILVGFTDGGITAFPLV